MHDSGLLTDADWHVYTAWRDATRRKWEAVRAPGIVYVRCGPEACERRIRRRGRHSEAHIERSYLELLHRTHEAYVASAECAVLRLDAETDTPETMADTFFDWIVSTFVKNSHK
jgi:deoxyadenosine/deoxycytidine kinase